MGKLLESFKQTTVRDIINSGSGFIYALRHHQLQGMTDQMRFKLIRNMQAGLLFLGVCIGERSIAGGMGAVVQMFSPIKRLSEAGKETMIRDHHDVGGVAASRMGAFMIVGTLAFGGIGNMDMNQHNMRASHLVADRGCVSLCLSKRQVPQPLRGLSFSLHR